jgi:tetratricopeptide (TPR) repeat protein
MNGDALYAQAKQLYDAANTKESMAVYEQARAAFIAEGNALLAARVANDLGVVYYLLGRSDDARRTFRDALASFEQLGDVLGQAKAIGNLAPVLERAGDRAGAEQNYLRAGELFQQLGEKTFEYDTYRALSQLQLSSGRWLEALASYDRALAAKGGARFLRWFLQIPLKILGLK